MTEAQHTSAAQGKTDKDSRFFQNRCCAKRHLNPPSDAQTPRPTRRTAVTVRLRDGCLRVAASLLAFPRTNPEQARGYTGTSIAPFPAPRPQTWQTIYVFVFSPGFKSSRIDAGDYLTQPGVVPRKCGKRGGVDRLHQCRRKVGVPKQAQVRLRRFGHRLLQSFIAVQQKN